MIYEIYGVYLIYIGATMANPRREIAPYRPPIGNIPTQSAPKPDPKPARKPADRPTDGPESGGPEKAVNRPSGESAGQDDVTVSTRLGRTLLAKLDRIRNRPGRPETTRSAALRWLVQTFDESTLD